MKRHTQALPLHSSDIFSLVKHLTVTLLHLTVLYLIHHKSLVFLLFSNDVTHLQYSVAVPNIVFSSYLGTLIKDPVRAFKYSLLDTRMQPKTSSNISILACSMHSVLCESTLCLSRIFFDAPQAAVLKVFLLGGCANERQFAPLS
jgi:hypothetical protein